MFLNRLILTFFFLCIGGVLPAQEISDALAKKVDFIYQLAEINLAEAVGEAQKLKDDISDYKDFDQVTIFLLLIDLQVSSGATEDAIANCKLALPLSEKTGYQKFTLNLQYYLANAYVENHQYAEAMEIYNKIFLEVDRVDLSYIHQLILVDFAHLNKRFENYGKALELLLTVWRAKDSQFIRNQPQYQKLLLDIADLYSELGKKDSMRNFVERYRAIPNEDKGIIIYENLIQGNIQYKNKRYADALELYDSYLTGMESHYDYLDPEITIRKARVLAQMGLWDSVAMDLETIKDLEGFGENLPITALANYYKIYSEYHRATGDDQAADEFYRKYIEAREKFNKSKFDTQEGLHEIKTKELLAQGAEQEQKYQTYIVAISTILGLLLLSGVGFYLVKANRDKKRFGELIALVESYERQQPTNDRKGSMIEELPRNLERHKPKTTGTASPDADFLDESERQETEGSDYPINDEKVQELLSKLEKLKGTGYFLRQDSSLYNTARRLKTNTTYLSSVINNHLNVNFNRFVNDIRMDYIIIELKNNKRMRSYSVKGIAEEIGYKSADSFSKYFKESTGLSPSTFIKNLNREYRV